MMSEPGRRGCAPGYTARAFPWRAPGSGRAPFLARLAISVRIEEPALKLFDTLRDLVFWLGREIGSPRNQFRLGNRGAGRLDVAERELAFTERAECRS